MRGTFSVLIAPFLLVCAPLLAMGEEPVTPIGSLVGNPSAFHRKVFKLEGVTRNVSGYSGSLGSTNQSLCGADFELEDGSGIMAVLYHVRCQAGGQQAMRVTEGMRVVVEGHMEAPPTIMRTEDGKDIGFWLMARTVTPVK